MKLEVRFRQSLTCAIHSSKRQSLRLHNGPTMQPRAANPQDAVNELPATKKAIQETSGAEMMGEIWSSQRVIQTDNERRQISNSAPCKRGQEKK